jgi:ABC-type antimicrobial peptide transport system permease subunit
LSALKGIHTSIGAQTAATRVAGAVVDVDPAIRALPTRVTITTVTFRTHIIADAVQTWARCTIVRIDFAINAFPSWVTSANIRITNVSAAAMNTRIVFTVAISERIRWSKEEYAHHAQSDEASP